MAGLAVLLSSCRDCADWAVPADHDAAAIATSNVFHQLVHGAKPQGYDRGVGASPCLVGITVRLDRRIVVDDDIPVTDAILPDACSHRPRRRLVYHLHATGIKSIGVTLDSRTHEIVYFRPNWDEPGARRLSQRWIGRGAPFPPAGD